MLMLFHQEERQQMKYGFNLLERVMALKVFAMTLQYWVLELVFFFSPQKR